MRPKILLHGDEVAPDGNLLGRLRKFAVVVAAQSWESISHILQKETIDVFVFESTLDWERDLVLLQIVRASYPDLILIVVDGGQSPDNVIRAFRIGVDDYFKKPLDGDLLAERIEALLKARS